MIEAWELVGERPGGAGYLPLATRSYALPDGSHADWDIFGWDQAAAVLAITPASQVVLARQFRPGPGVVLDELPGGLVEPDEEVVPAATRELLEETGYAGEAELAGSCWMAAACRTLRHVVVVRNARRIADPAPDHGEFVGVVLKSLGMAPTAAELLRRLDVDADEASVEDLPHNRWLSPGVWRVRIEDGRQAVLKYASAERPSGETAWEADWTADDEDPRRWNYWCREPIAYQSEFLVAGRT